MGDSQSHMDFLPNITKFRNTFDDKQGQVKATTAQWVWLVCVCESQEK